MSLLVGLRGQTRETDGTGLREGITQQPGPFYNGNPSSIIWGNPPPSPLWRDDNGSPFFKTKYAGFGTSKPQQFGREEKQKESSEVVAEGKPPLAAKRSPILSESVPNVNSNPGFSPFTFGFPPHSSAASSSSPALGSEPSGMSTSGAAPSDNSFTGAESNEFTRGTRGVGGDGSDIRSWQIPRFQNERLKDVGAVTSATANLTLNDHGNNSKFWVDSKDRAEGSASDVSASPVTGFDFTGKFRSLGLGNPPREPSLGRQDKPGVFVFGASFSSENESAPAASPPSDSASHTTRPRLLKVKRGVLATKCKGPAADNGASLSATSSEGVHLNDFRAVDGESQHFQPSVGLDEPPPTKSTLHYENSAFQRFVPPSLRPSEQSISESNGRFTSGKDQASSSAGHRPFFNFEFGKNSRSTGEINIRLEDSSAAEALLSASTAKIDASGSPLFSRNPNTESGRFDSSSGPGHSLNISVGDYTDNASKDVSGKSEFPPGRVAMKGQVTEDLSSELNLKLGLGCGEGAHEKKVFPKSGVAGKPVGTQANESGDSTHGGLPFAAKDEMKSTKENRDAGRAQFSTASTSSTPGFPKLVKDAVSEKSGRPVEAAPRVRSEPDTPKAKPEPFVFGASRKEVTSSRPRAVKTSSAFKLHGGSRSASPSQNSSSEGSSNGRAANSAASDLFSSKQEDPAPKRNASLEFDLNSLPFSFSGFSLGAATPSIRVNAETGPFSVSPPGQTPIFTPGLSKPSGGPSHTQRPIPGRMSPAIGKGDPVDSEASGSASSSHFVFSAGTDPAPSTRTDSSAPATPLENKFINRFRRSVTIEGDAPATSALSGVQSAKSQPSGTSGKTFEFRASIDGGDESSKGSAARKKTYRVQAGRRQGRSRAPTKERPESFVSFDEAPRNLDESGTPMDFSPQRYTPPDDVMPEIQQMSEHAAWGNRSPSRVRLGLDVDEDWAHYFETEEGLGNLRSAADDPPVEARPGPRDAWKDMAKSENEFTWWTGKENVPKKSMGRSGKWKRAVFDENHVPFAGRDNTWNGIKLETANRPDSGASSSTPSGDSSASSGGWGQFTFTAGSSNFSSTTSLLRRHARRIQRDKPSPGSEGTKSGTSTYKGESMSTPVFRNGTTSAAGTTSTMSRPAFSVDGRANVSVESGRGFAASKGGSWDPARVPSAVSSSRSNSWSSESSTSVGSLPRSEAAKPADPQTVGAAATEQACEKWRLRGNQAYADGDFPKAEEYYSRGASSVLPNETSQSCIRASMLCYSNRAATRMVVGRMREALADCMRATAVDPNFLRVRLRAASCHLALGETECAALAFEECLRRVKEDDQLDSKVSSEASEGLRKSKQVDEYLVRAQEILAKGGAGDTPTALRLLNEALLSSPHSEKAIELKGRAFLLLRRYEDVVQICEQSLLSAERNHPLPNGDAAIHQLLQPAAGDTVKLGGAASSLKMWRWQLIAKAKFHLGRLEEALELLQKSIETSKELSKDGISFGSSSSAEPSVLSIGNIRDLLRHKAAGNDAFQSGKHTEAVEHYSAALACNGDSRPFNAVCFCNRAAASQALGNIADAISDCSRAIALDPKYAKAISRRATLHEKVRDYGQSCADLQKLVGLIESQHQLARAGVAPGWAGRSTTSGQQDLWQARDRLAKTEEEMKKGHPLDHYTILGLEPTCSSNEIKKAYRKAALRHHPDKAGQFLGRSDSGDDGGTWKEVTDEVRSDAERLFKLIGEANAILSDNQKRSRYDSEEEFRKLRTRSSSAACGFSDVYRSTERGHASSSRRPRERWDSWTGYSHQNQRWQSGPDAAQPDTYARRTRYGSNQHSRSNVDGGRWNDYDWDDM